MPRRPTISLKLLRLQLQVAGSVRGWMLWQGSQTARVLPMQPHHVRTEAVVIQVCQHGLECSMDLVEVWRSLHLAQAYQRSQCGKISQRLGAKVFWPKEPGCSDDSSRKTWVKARICFNKPRRKNTINP